MNKSLVTDHSHSNATYLVPPLFLAYRARFVLEIDIPVKDVHFLACTPIRMNLFQMVRNVSYPPLEIANNVPYPRLT